MKCSDCMSRHGGIGLAAPQVGIDGRFFVTAWGDIFINPEIVAVSEEMHESREGCLSIPGKQFVVRRHKWVRLRGDNRKWKGIKASVIAHECDHLNGILISDVGQELCGGHVPLPSRSACASANETQPSPSVESP
jgi:peptide deformylase